MKWDSPVRCKIHHFLFNEREYKTNRSSLIRISRCLLGNKFLIVEADSTRENWNLSLMKEPSWRRQLGVWARSELRLRLPKRKSQNQNRNVALSSQVNGQDYQAENQGNPRMQPFCKRIFVTLSGDKHWHEFFPYRDRQEARAASQLLILAAELSPYLGTLWTEETQRAHPGGTRSCCFPDSPAT